MTVNEIQQTSAPSRTDDRVASRPSTASYVEVDRPLRTPVEHGSRVDDIQRHLEQHLGPMAGAFTEAVSDMVTLDVLVFPATDERPFHVLSTSGMSDLEMQAPQDHRSLARAELLILLPPSWPLDLPSLQSDDNAYWPIYSLKQIARLPHEYASWIGPGHLVPNGDPAQPIADTAFTGILVVPPLFRPPAFAELHTDAGEVINFYLIFPVYTEEMELVVRDGVEALQQAFVQHGTSLIADPSRPNVAAPVPTEQGQTEQARTEQAQTEQAQTQQGPQASAGAGAAPAGTPSPKPRRRRGRHRRGGSGKSSGTAA